MARLKVEISRTAERQLKKIPAADQAHVVRTIRALAKDPFPKGSRKLSGYDDVFGSGLADIVCCTAWRSQS